ncbi:DMT family transporter [Malaciobacter marinus]|uniref:EamA/RhaT family transporter n=2 Tax=Malaciobacter marinus TaxID=505249 RepID=A0A347TLN8_9BACT|nr:MULTISPECIES: DMT family transporter [Malaciobacter]AXX87516.1 EamA/RhaT family transporter [Malaciobacter marinus]
MKNTSTLQAHMYVLFATFLVAGSFLASQRLANVVNPLSLTFLRFIGAIIIMAPFILFRKSLRDGILKTLPRALVISLFYSLYFMGMFEALKLTTVLNTGTLYTLVPLMTAILALFIFKEKISFNKLLVYLIGLIGTLWVIFKGNLELLLSFSLNDGDYIFIIGSFCMCCYSISIKLLYRNDNPLVLVFCTLIGGAIWMALGMMIFQKPLNWELIEGNLIYHMLYLIIGTTIITLFLYQKSTVILGPTKVMSYIYLNPVAVAILLLIIDHKSIETIVIPGIIITSIATFLLQKNKRLKK